MQSRFARHLVLRWLFDVGSLIFAQEWFRPGTTRPHQRRLRPP